MCGIAGVFYFTQPDMSHAESAMDKMLNSLHHRGPDAKNKVIISTSKDNCGLLGHTRLAVRDLDARANQPFNTGKLSLVYNGEVYNEDKLKEKYGLPDLITTSDTEIVAKLLDQNDIKTVTNEFDGMFAFAAYHQTKEALFLARDRFSQKPLYYYLDNHKLIFASELRALIASEFFEVKLSKDGISDYLTYGHSVGERTLIANVYMLKAGTIATVNENGFEIEPYVKEQKPFKENNLQDYKEQFANLFTSSIKRQMISDVKLGVYLSGGLDSSVVAAVSKSINPKIETISLVFPELDKQDNIYSKKVAEHISSNHIEIAVNYEYFVENINAYLATIDSPSYDGLNSYVISKLAKERGFTVCLSGLGGDEYFGGYYTFNLLNRSKKINKFPKLIKSFLKGLIPYLWFLKEDKKYLAARLLSIKSTNCLADYHSNITAIFSNQQRNSLLGALISQNATNQSLYGSGTYDMCGVAEAEMSIFMGDQLLRDGDQTSMAVSLETRFPLLDIELSEFIKGLPPEVRFDNIPKKQFFYDSFMHLLPDDFLERKKEGFSFPMHEWTMKFAVPNLISFCEDPEILSLVPIDFKLVSRLINDFKAGKNRHEVRWTQVWSLFVLLSWIRRNLL